MKIIECEQGSEAWHAARCGRVTASRVADIVRKIKSGAPSKMRATYLGELVAERLSGVQSADGFTSAAMQWGKDREAEAVAAYQFETMTLTSKIGFVVHPTMDWAGASPDRLVGEIGILQIKAPNSATHIESLKGAAIDPDYWKQMQWEMACCPQCKWCDFGSYDPRMPENMRLLVQRVPRDDRYIAELEGEVAKFLAEVEADVAALNARYGLEKAA